MTGKDWEFSEGDKIAPELTAMRLLGGGHSYEAYLAFDEITHGPVVVKVLRPHLVDDESALRGLRREIEALNTLNHPVVVRGLGHHAESERPYLVLENIDGPRLSSLIRRHGPLAEPQYLALGIEIASSLHYFAHMGWVHLDIKPSNIIMAAPARLIDLSVARTVEKAADLTTVIGTDDYLSPEQADPPHTGRPGTASDIWGLAATMFQAVSGRRPFPAGDLDADDVAVRYPQLEQAPRELPDRVPAEVGDVIYAGLAKDPTLRPSPAEFAQALEPVLARQPRARLTYKVR